MMMMSYPPFSSPTISSVSSSDFDTESTGSFFHDRSITLGALMGVATSFPAITFLTPPRQQDHAPAVTRGPVPNHRTGGRRRSNANANTMAGVVAERRRKKVRRRNWWWLCSGEASKPCSLGELLAVERRFAAEMLFSDALMDVDFGDHHRNGGRMLFSDGRVLPPAPQISDVNEGTPYMCSLCKFPIMLAAICGGGGVR